MKKIMVFTLLATALLLPLANAQMSIWNIPQSASQGHWLVGQMLDTFQMNIHISSPQNITVAVMTLDQYSILRADVMLHLNVPYNTIAFYNGTDVRFQFNTSIGCDSYLYIIYNNDY